MENLKLSELKSMIQGTVAAHGGPSKASWKAMAAIKWRLRGPVGQYVGLGHGFRCAFVPESKAMVFDGRDNEEMKLATYEAELGELTVEILPYTK